MCIKRKDGRSPKKIKVMKLNRNEFTIGNKTYRLNNTEYAFMDAVSSICTVLCSAMAGTGTDYDVEMEIPLAEDESAKFSAGLDRRHVNMFLNDSRMESGDIVDIVNGFVESVREAANGYAGVAGGGMIGEDAESNIRDDIQTLEEMLEEAFGKEA